MADEPTTQQPISDDQELAKVLAGVSAQTEMPPLEDPAAATPTADPVVMPADDTSTSTEEPAVTPVEDLVSPLATPVVAGELDGIKLEALNELRPLVDKLNVSPEEKFDTYLLLLRSTDDKELIAPAHDAAKAISDEARRAQALLDIIKEIDFLSQNQPAA